MTSGNTVEIFVMSLFLEQVPRLNAPDGRPLYGYRVLPDRYEKLANRLRFQFPEILRGTASERLAAGFVLYAAETWRRNEDISRWNSWDVVLAGLGQHDVQAQDLYPVVRRGLRYWRRDLRKLGGRNMYLATLVCEGGLPLHLVQGSQSPFRRYLRDLVAHARDFGTAQAVLAAAAERLADVLPRSLRHEVVHEMAAELVARLVELHRKVDGCQGDPIDHLDQLHEHWRDTLPLRLDDALARTLLRELLQDVREITAARGALPRAHRWLEQREEGYCLRARLEVPRPAKLARFETLWGSQQEFPHHARLALVSGSAAQAPFGTAFRRQENLSFEVASSRRAEVEHNEATANLRLEVDAGTKVGDTRILDVPGGQALSTSQPWVFFREEGDGGRVVLVADGSCRTRHAEVLVAVPKGMHVLAGADGSVEGMAQSVPALERELHRCRGRVRFENGEGDVWFVATAQEGDTLLEFDLGGDRLEGCALNSTQIFCGIPRVVARDSTGDPVRPPAYELEWRPARGGAAWSPDPKAALGLLDVRVRVDGDTRLRRKVAVLPEDFEWRLQETGPRAGTLRLSGLGGGTVLVKQSRDLDVELRAHTELDAIDLHCTAGGAPPASVSIQVALDDAVPLDLVLPTPIRSGFFVTGEGAKVERDYVPVDDLYAFRVQLVTAEKRARYALRGRLTSREGVGGASLSELNRNIHLCLPLREVSEGRYEAELRHLVDPVRRAMRVVPQLDLQVLLRLEKNGTEQPGLQLEVQRYAATLECNWEESWVGIKTMSPVIEGREHDIRVRTFPLWLPTTPDEELPALPTETPTWSFDAPHTEPGIARRVPGTWFLHGSLEGRACTRPRIWVVSGGSSLTPGNLHQQAVLAAPEARDAALRALYAGLTAGTDESAWVDLIALLERCDQLPAAGFDTIRGLVQEPALLVALLVGAHGKLRETVFDLREELPFEWAMLPLSAWVEGCRIGLRRLGSQYIADGLGADDIREYVKLRFLRLLAWLPAGEQVLRDLLHWAGSSFVDGVEPPHELRVASKPAQFVQVVQEQLETAWMEMLRRRVHDGDWPRFHTLSTWEPAGVKPAFPMLPVVDVTSEQRSVLRAPWVAACRALREEPADPVMTLGLLQSRAFDFEWFDLAHRMYLVAAMALYMNQGEPRT